MKIWKRKKRIVVGSKEKSVSPEQTTSKESDVEKETAKNPSPEQTPLKKSNSEDATSDKSNSEEAIAKKSSSEQTTSKKPSQKQITSKEPSSEHTTLKLPSPKQATLKLPSPTRKSPMRLTLKNIPLEAIKSELTDIDDAIFKEFQTKQGLVTIVYFSSLIESLLLHKTVVTPLVNDAEKAFETFDNIEQRNMQVILSSISNGDTILYYHEKQKFVKAKTYSPPQRAITSSENESTVIGPQDAFTESLATNLSLIKRRIQQPGLKNKDQTIGKETNTKISVLYIDHIVNNENLKLINERLDKLTYEGFFDITILKQLIEDNPYSVFPQFLLTSKPDAAVQFLLDGRIVIAMENSQSVLVLPVSFFEMFTSTEDFYNRWTTTSLLRTIRFLGFFITIMLTPLYISVLSYHSGVLPFELLIIIQESRSKVPFPPVIEVLFIELVIEVLREAGSRMPTKIGQTIGIVGGIVIGTAAVEAGLVSNILIVLVAISALLSFSLPNFLMSNASRVIRYIFILAAGLFGLLGQFIAFAWLFNHLLNLTSLGSPYMTPVIPRAWSDMYNSIIRFPLSFIKKRSRLSRSKQVKKASK